MFEPKRKVPILDANIFKSGEPHFSIKKVQKVDSSDKTVSRQA
jgi:hypothetical protein